jgi:hypothetical protein
MDKRQTDRLMISEGNREYLREDQIAIEFDAGEKIRGKAVNISQNGIGFEIKGLSRMLIDEIIDGEEMFLKLYAGSDYILAGVKIKWTLIKEEKGETVFKGGTEINIISSEDNLKLAGFIEKIRSSTSV